MLCIDEIIEKLKDILSKELGDIRVLDKDIAAALQMDYNRFRKQKSRSKTIPYIEVMTFLAKRNISINWFFFNQLPESLIDTTSNYIILKYQKAVIGSAGGGALNYEIDSTPLILDKQLLDHINSSYKYTEILQVFGESMEPDIKDGSLVFVDRNQVDINKGGVYAINTEDGLFIKSISLKENHYHMLSINKQYKDMKLNEFQVIGKVKGVFYKF